jgi:hypothetical protein
MLVTQVLDGRAIALRERQVAQDAEARAAKCGKEAIRMGPAVEADGEAVALQDAVHFGKAGLSHASLSSPGTLRPSRDA